MLVVEKGRGINGRGDVGTRTAEGQVSCRSSCRRSESSHAAVERVDLEHALQHGISSMTNMNPTSAIVEAVEDMVRCTKAVRNRRVLDSAI